MKLDKNNKFFFLDNFKEYLLANDKDANLIGWTMVRKAINPKDMNLNDITKLYIDVQRFYYNSKSAIPKEGKAFRFKVIKYRSKFSKKNRADSFNRICAEIKSNKNTKDGFSAVDLPEPKKQGI
jgi:hypothetical protein